MVSYMSFQFIHFIKTLNACLEYHSFNIWNSFSEINLITCFKCLFCIIGSGFQDTVRSKSLQIGCNSEVISMCQHSTFKTVKLGGLEATSTCG